MCVFALVFVCVVVLQRELEAMAIESRAVALEEKTMRLQEFEETRALQLQEMRDSKKKEQRRREELQARVKAQDGLYRSYVRGKMSKKMSHTASVQRMREEVRRCAAARCCWPCVHPT